MRKKLEYFYFFEINNATSFKEKLHDQILDSITTTTQLLSTSTQPIVAVNLAFSHTGFLALGVPDVLNDPVFSAGQQADAVNLGDPGTTNWVPAFLGTQIHGVFLLASDDITFLNAQVSVLNSVFGTDITNLYTLLGNIRPPPNDGHES